MKRIRIYTEDINREGIEELADSFFGGYSVYETDGVWKGQHEKSLVIEVIIDNPFPAHIFAGEIKRLNHQDSVLVTVEEIEEVAFI